MDRVDIICFSILGFLTFICIIVCIYDFKDEIIYIINILLCGLIKKKKEKNILIFPEIESGPNKGIRIV